MSQRVKGKHKFRIFIQINPDLCLVPRICSWSDIQYAYALAQELTKIFDYRGKKIYATTKLALWHEKVAQAELKVFNTVSRTIQNHYKTILNYFDNRSTNAFAESFNAKIKAFRAQFRGVTNVGFFLFRLTQIYAWLFFKSTDLCTDPILHSILTLVPEKKKASTQCEWRGTKRKKHH